MPDTLVNVLELRKRVRRDCPIYPNSWVEFYDDLTINEVESVTIAMKSDSEKDKSASMTVTIADWNFAGLDGQKLEISYDTLKQLPQKVVLWLGESAQEIFTQAQKVDEDKKKASLEDLTPPSTP